MDILQCQRALEKVVASSLATASPLHGLSHWLQVARNGLRLLDRDPSADPLVVLLFSILHDSQRVTDGHDPDHGKRAAVYVRQQASSGQLELNERQHKLLVAACYGHSRGTVTTDPTIGTAWDADRLDLPRVGLQPAPALLSTLHEPLPPVTTRGGAGLDEWEDVLVTYASL